MLAAFVNWNQDSAALPLTATWAQLGLQEGTTVQVSSLRRPAFPPAILPELIVPDYVLKKMSMLRAGVRSLRAASVVSERVELHYCPRGASRRDRILEVNHIVVIQSRVVTNGMFGLLPASNSKKSRHSTSKRLFGAGEHKNTNGVLPNPEGTSLLNGRNCCNCDS